MEGWILNKEFQSECILDGFESFIWTDRYSSPGDFEIYMPLKLTPMDYVTRGKYIWMKHSDRLMIIEDIEITTDVEVGPHVTMTGRSLEILLERRIIADQLSFNGDLQDCISDVLNLYVINPVDSGQKIPFLQFKRNDDKRLKDLTIQGNYFGYTVLEFIQDVCILHDLGFRIRYDDQELDHFVFEVYYGEDRSYDQEDNPWVIFSQKYDNLINSNYYESDRNLRTVAIVAGDSDNTYGQVIISVPEYSSINGIDRREMFVDASDIEVPSDEVDEEEIRERILKKDPYTPEWEITEAITRAKEQEYLNNLQEYIGELAQRGYEELAKTQIVESFEGEIEATRQYVYGKDFFIGDIVQIRDDYGREASSRITEVVRSHDVSGEKLLPTFTTLNKDEEDE